MDTSPNMPTLDELAKKSGVKQIIPQSNSSSGGISLDQLAQKSGVSAIDTTQPTSEPRLVERIGTDLSNRKEQLQKDISGFKSSDMTNTGNQAKLGFNVAQDVLGGVFDIANEGIGSLFGMIGKVASPIIQDWAKAHPEAAKTVKEVLQPTVSTGNKIIEKGTKSYEALPPEAQRKVKGTAEIIGGLQSLELGGALAKTAGSAVGKTASTTAKFAVGKASGLSPTTIETALTRGAELKAAEGGLTREAIGQKVQTGFDALEQNISETGKGYEMIRNSGNTVDIPQGYWEGKLADSGIRLDSTGNVDLGASRAMTQADKNAIDFFLNNYAKEGSVTADDFLRSRESLANIAKYDTAKSGTSQLVAGNLRYGMNEDFRPQIPNLAETDTQYAPLRSFLKETKTVMNREGNVKLSTVVNALKKGREEIAVTLDKLHPGITKDLELLSALEDIELASGHKVGTYAQNILFGGGVGSLAGGIPGGIIGLLISQPKIIVPLLEQLSIVGSVSRDVINGIKNKLWNGVKPTVEESKIIKQALMLPAEGKSSAKGFDISPVPIITPKPTPNTTFEPRATKVGVSPNKQLALPSGEPTIQLPGHVSSNTTFEKGSKKIGTTDTSISTYSGSNEVIKKMFSGEGDGPPCVQGFKKILVEHPDAQPIRGVFGESLKDAKDIYQITKKGGGYTKLDGFTHVEAKLKDGTIIENLKGAVKGKNDKFFSEKQITNGQ